MLIDFERMHVTQVPNGSLNAMRNAENLPEERTIAIKVVTIGTNERKLSKICDF